MIALFIILYIVIAILTIMGLIIYYSKTEGKVDFSDVDMYGLIYAAGVLWLLSIIMLLFALLFHVFGSFFEWFASCFERDDEKDESND